MVWINGVSLNYVLEVVTDNGRIAGMGTVTHDETGSVVVIAHKTEALVSCRGPLLFECELIWNPSYYAYGCLKCGTVYAGDFVRKSGKYRFRCPAEEQ